MNCEKKENCRSPNTLKSSYAFAWFLINSIISSSSFNLTRSFFWNCYVIMWASLHWPFCFILIYETGLWGNGRKTENSATKKSCRKLPLYSKPLCFCYQAGCWNASGPISSLLQSAQRQFSPLLDQPFFSPIQTCYPVVSFLGDVFSMPFV